MKTRKSKLKSFFAMLLVVTTVCQQSSLTVLATDDTYEVMDQTEVTDTSEGLEAYEQGAETVDASSEENASEPETVVTDIPAEVTDVPAENPITETPAEPTETPVTEVPAEPTEAPVTEVPAEPTEVPVTEAPAEPTEAPAPETSPTVAPETTSVPQSEETEVSKTSFTYEDNRVVITATAPEEANLPQDSELKADYLQPGSETYNAAVAAFNSQLADELGLNGENRTAEYVLYDVYFLTADGSRIEPESGHVKVDMTFKQIQESTVDGEVVNKDVVHLKNDGVAEVVTEYVNTNAEGEVTSMGFSQDSFSIVAGVTVYDSDNADGEGENAAENSNIATVADLTELLTSVDLYGATVGEDGKLHVISNAAGYEIQLNFKEQYEKQFANGETLTYKLPAGIVSENANGTFSIKIKDHTGAVKEIQGNSYTVASDGTVSINFNQDDPNYASLTASANVKFGLRLSVKFDNKVIKDKIDFGNSVTKDVIVDDVHKLEIRKSGTLQDDGKMHYSVEITSTGNNTDVFVQDAIKGDILTFDDNVTLSSNKSRSDLDAVNSNKESNGFSLTIPSMEHGEKITLNYTASVNWEKVGAGTVSKDDKTNTVKVKSKENPNEVKKDYEYTNEIRYDAISKGHSEPIGNTSKTIDWTLDVNSKKYLTFANQTIKDSIAAESQNIMHYTGDGITILVKKDDGTEEIRNVK